MPSRALRGLACAVALAVLGTAVAAVVLVAVAASRGAPVGAGVTAVALWMAAILVPALVGLFVAWRQPGNRVAWILLVGALSVTVVMTAYAVAGLALERDPGSTVGAWAASVAEVWPVLFLWQLALAFVYPDGRLLSPRWRNAALFACVACGGLVFALFFAPEHDSEYGLVPSPLPVTLGHDAALVMVWTCWVGLLLSLFAGAAALRARYKAGGPAAAPPGAVAGLWRAAAPALAGRRILGGAGDRWERRDRRDRPGSCRCGRRWPWRWR
jgi:hypothetical protein